MDENKEKLTGTPENDDIRNEMEDLARIFKEELDKAVKDAETANQADSTTLEVEGYDPRAVSRTAKKKEAVKLCEICGQRPCGTEKNPDSSYCKDCEELLEKYPYDWKGVAAVLVCVCIAVAAVFLFAIDTPIFSAMKRGDEAYKNNQLFSARAEYDKALNYVDEEDFGKNLSLHAKDALLNYDLLDRESALSTINTYFNETLLKLPAYKDLGETEEKIASLQATASAIQNHLYNYAAISDNNYQEIIDMLSSLSGKKIYVKNDMCYDELDEDYTPDGTEKVYTYDEGWLYLYKYSIAYEAGKDEATMLGFLEKAVEYESLDSLVTPLLATTYVGIGEYEKAEKLTDKILALNAEGIDYHLVYAMLYRYRDADYQKAIDICDDGLEVLTGLDNATVLLPAYGYILEMQKSINYIMLEDYEKAYEAVTNSYEYQTQLGSYDIQVRDLYAMLALQTGDKTAFEAIETEIAESGEYGVAFTDDVTAYREGKKTLQDIVMDGGYDLL